MIAQRFHLPVLLQIFLELLKRTELNLFQMFLSNSFTKNVSKADKVKCKSSCALIVIMQSGSLVHDQITTYSQT